MTQYLVSDELVLNSCIIELASEQAMSRVCVDKVPAMFDHECTRNYDETSGLGLSGSGIATASAICRKHTDLRPEIVF